MRPILLKLLVATILIFPHLVPAQSLISIDLIDTYDQSELYNITGYDAVYEVRVYRVLYETTDLDDNPINASGVLAVPNHPNGNAYALPTLLYEHGTPISKEGVASENAGEINIILTYASQGYITIAPDLLGLGSSPGFHPYLDARTEASASADMVTALNISIDLLEPGNNSVRNSRFFITGYSGGAHASMATQKALEEGTEDIYYELTATAHSSGPYSLSGEMIDFTLGDDPYTFPAFLPFAALGLFIEAEGLYDSVEELFKPAYVGPIQQFQNWEIDLIALNLNLAALLTLNEGGLYAKEMLQDSIADAILTNPDHPMNQVLQKNDLYDWTPQAPTRLFYCSGDDIVTYTNSILAETTMLDNGATDLEAQDLSPNSNHINCVPSAVSATLDYFNQSAGIYQITSTKQLAAPYPWSIRPNPSPGELRIELPDQLALRQFHLYDAQGERIYSASSFSPEEAFEFQHLAPGFYVVQLISEQGETFQQAWMKQ